MTAGGRPRAARSDMEQRERVSAEDPLTESPAARTLREKLAARTAAVVVVGLGYVGLPLAVTLAGSGFRVHGIDADPERASLANAGTSYIGDVASDDLARLVTAGRFSAAATFEAVAPADAILVCVPTPLRKTREPDISFVLSAFESLVPWLRPGQLLVLESTTYPGTTEEVLLPRIEAKGFRVGQDFFLAFSPERVDPGNPAFTTATIPKVVGGVTRTCTEMAAALYEACTAQVHRVSSPRVAETAKLLENTFRSVNIALANELALACRALGVNPWEVIAAAATKPFGFMPFYPGPGTGGHCIPLDPLYLSWIARLKGFEPRFIALADEINRTMPRHAVTLVMDALNDRRKCLQGAEVLVLGVTYKRDVSDVRESPALEIMHLLAQRGAQISYADPHVPQLLVGDLKLASAAFTAEALRRADCVVIATDHRAFDYALIAREASLVVDLRNALGGIREHREKIVTL
jgi:UDP-N-acetyl-D-glucosamine dehydrogenase